MTPTTSTTSTALRGPWLLVIRLTWLALAVFVVALLIIGLPGAYQSYANDSSALSQTLQQQGLPAGWRVLYSLGWQFAAMISFGIVALIIAWRKFDDWMGLFTSAVCLTFGVGFSSFIFLAGIYEETLLATWTPPVVDFSRALGFIFSVIVLFILPDGRFVPRWSRWLALLWSAWMIGGVFVHPLNIYDYPSPFFLGIQIIMYGVGIVMQVYRYRHVSSPLQRQQTKWIIWGIAATLVGYVVSNLVYNFPYKTPHQAELVQLLYEPFYYMPRILLAVTIGLAILRHHLWDIDFIINRSVVYGMMTALLAAFFGISLFAITRLFQSFANGPFAAVAISAVAFGAIFQPARQYLKRFVDQRFYNIQIDYQKSAYLPAASLLEGATQIIKQARFAEYGNLQLIGRGGMAEVYKADHPTRHRPVAIKVLPALRAMEPEFRQRFLREAQLVSKLEHPNIVRMFDYGEENGICYIVMEYLNGQDLGRYLRQVGRLPLAQVRLILGNVAAALDYAHEAGLVHRDIKPSNVMLDEDGKGIDLSSEEAPSFRAVLTDFGIARVIGGQTMLTSAGGIVGTFDYIAPEQIQASTNVDGRADVYSLGVMAYQMLTGELPFRQKNPGSLLMAHLLQPPPDASELIPTLPKSVSAALQKAMTKKPEERFATAGKFTARLSGS